MRGRLLLVYRREHLSFSLSLHPIQNEYRRNIAQYLYRTGSYGLQPRKRGGLDRFEGVYPAGHCRPAIFTSRIFLLLRSPA